MSVEPFHCQQRIKELEELSWRAAAENRLVGATWARVAHIGAGAAIAELWSHFVNPAQALFEGLLATTAGPIGALVALGLRMVKKLKKIGGLLKEANRLRDTTSARIDECEKLVAEASAEADKARAPLIDARSAVGEASALAHQADQAGMA